jgi:predicted metal-dependent hydrolase
MMLELKRHNQSEDFSGAWCNTDPVTSSVLEAVSLITPVLEKFFIRTVADALPETSDAALAERCQEFIREESNHSRVHHKFNASLFRYLGKTPPGLAFMEALLNGVRRHLSLNKQLMLASALEHLTAVLSTAYLKQEKRLNMDSAFARELFTFHAHEEIAHCSVVFDLWRTRPGNSHSGRMLTILSILLAGAIYIGLAVPWILYRKNGKQLGRTARDLLRQAFRSPKGIKQYSPLVEMFSFTRHGYHPDLLFKAGQ